MRTRIKLCGMTRPGDLAAAAELGVDAVGLIFAEASPRRLSPAQARTLRAAAPPMLTVVALFRDNAEDAIAAAIDAARPQLLQFHGDEDEAACARWGVPYLRAVPMGSLHAEAAGAFLARYPSAAGFVLDGHRAGGAGGSGRRFDWRQVPDLAGRPWLLAGGLTPDNVADAVLQAGPWGVDASSGVESAPGIKDAQRMHRFVQEVRRADARSTD